MRQSVFASLAVLVGLATGMLPAHAHPHVWVVVSTELVYAPDGALTGVRHAWTFDDMFSAFATQGLEQKTKGTFTREELAPLAEVNITSMKEFDYFTFATINGTKAAFADPREYWLDYKDGVLTLNFTLPLQRPLRAKSLTLEVYDPSYFVDFALAEKDPVRLAGAPAACRLALATPQPAALAQAQRLSEAFFNDPARAGTFGAQFANRITVSCP